MGSKRYRMLRIWLKMFKMVQKFSNWHETGKNGARQLKWMKLGQDWTKWFKSGPNWSKKDQKNLSYRVCFAAKNISSIYSGISDQTLLCSWSNLVPVKYKYKWKWKPNILLPSPPMIVCVMSHQTVQTPPVIAAGCVTLGVMVAVCDTQGTS